MDRKIFSAISLFAFLFLQQALVQGQTRIMPLGDSITQSDTGHNSYRRPLWQMLENTAYSGDFVGSLTEHFGGPPPTPDFDTDHEGHWGWRADQVLANINAWAASAQPDIVLIHLGHNDLWQGQSVSSTITELGQIIDEVRLVNSSAIFLLSQVIPATSGIGLDQIPDLNAQIPALAASKHSADSPVVVVDQYTGFDPDTDTWDGVHPNASGEQKMAQNWFDAIQLLEFPLRINFQPAASIIPDGYRADDGSDYAVHDGYNYGWH